MFFSDILIEKIRRTVEAHKMLDGGGRVVVALSGGADSMTLLSVLLRLKDELGITVEAAHVNHCLRGAESDGDERFVRETCEKLGVKLSVLRADIRAEAEKSGDGLELCGRRVRYEFFESICAEKTGAQVTKKTKIATAHTKSDSLETTLFNLTRGTGLRGLCGVPAVRGAHLIRPLIDCARFEIERYCAENGIEYVTDSTNGDNAYARNLLRNTVVPRLREINPSVEEAAARCMRSLRDDADFLDSCAADLAADARTQAGWSAEKLLSAHPAVRSRAVLALLNAHMSSPQSVHVALVTDILRAGGAVTLGAETAAAVKNGELFFKFRATEIMPWEAPFARLGLTELPFGSVETAIIHKSELNRIQKIHKEVLANCLDYDKILINSAHFRSRREGDRLSQANGSCTKTLKKIFNEKKIPPQERRGVVLLADENGVLWVEGYGCDARARITDETRRVLTIKINRGEPEGERSWSGT